MKKKPKLGRPVTTGTSPQVALRLSPELLELLDAKARALGGVSRSTAIKMAIAAWVKS